MGEAEGEAIIGAVGSLVRRPLEQLTCKIMMVCSREAAVTPLRSGWI